MLYYSIGIHILEKRESYKEALEEAKRRYRDIYKDIR